MKLLVVFLISFFALSRAQTVHLEDYRIALNTSSNLDEYFGYSIEVVQNSSLVIIGQPRTPNGGNVHIYQLQTTYTTNSTTNETVIFETWNLLQTIVGSDTGQGDDFGYSISAVEDGSTIVVGAPNFEPGTDAANGPYNQFGKIYVFTRTGQTWAQTSTIYLSTNVFYDKFGIDVQISADGNTIIGACSGLDDNTRMGIRIFEKNGNNWNQVVQLNSNVFRRPGSLGFKFSATQNFDYIAVKTTGDFNQVTLYQRAGASNWTTNLALTHPTTRNNSWFGAAIAFDRYADNSLLIGAPRFPESAHLYSVPSFNLVTSFNDASVQNTAFGTEVHVATTPVGRYAAVGAPIDFGSEKGKTFVYKYNDNTSRWEPFWMLQSRDFSFDSSSIYPYPGFPTNVTYNTGDLFGKSVFISQRHIYVGAPLENALYIFRLPAIKNNTRPDVVLPSFPSEISGVTDGNDTLYYGLIAGGIALLLLLITGFVVLAFIMKKRRQAKIKQLAEKYVQLQQGGKPVKKFSSSLAEQEPLAPKAKSDEPNWVDTQIYKPE